MTKRVRVNVKSLANSKDARREKRNGRDVIVVPSATLPDNVVMNRIMYSADEIEKSYRSLNRTPAPAGHPLINGQFVSARDPEGINIGWIGAWNENVRRENGFVFLDKVIDIQRANQSDEGKAVLAAIDKGEPIHTSTGLYCNLEVANGHADYDSFARDIEFDHDAILLNEEGAATPTQGVGMLVNSQGEQEQIEVINSALDDAERDLDWAADMAARAVERMERAPLLDRIKSAIMEAVRGTEREQSTNKEDMDMDKEQFDALSAKVNDLAEAQGKIGETVANAVKEAMKPLTDNMEAMQANQKAKDDAEKADLEAKVVKANILDADTARETPLNTLRKLAEKAKPGKAAAMNGAFDPGEDDEWAGYSLNSHVEEKKGAH